MCHPAFIVHNFVPTRLLFRRQRTDIPSYIIPLFIAQHCYTLASDWKHTGGSKSTRNSIICCKTRVLLYIRVLIPKTQSTQNFSMLCGSCDPCRASLSRRIRYGLQLLPMSLAWHRRPARYTLALTAFDMRHTVVIPLGSHGLFNIDWHRRDFGTLCRHRVLNIDRHRCVLGCNLVFASDGCDHGLPALICADASSEPWVISVAPDVVAIEGLGAWLICGCVAESSKLMSLSRELRCV